MQSRFWEYINNHGGAKEFWKHQNYSAIMHEVHLLLMSEVSDKQSWANFKYDSVSLFLALASGAADGKSPKVMQYDPKNVTLHVGEDEFKKLLFQKPPRGTVPFVYDILGTDSLIQPGHGERLVTYLRGMHFFSEEDDQPFEFEWVVVGFIRGEKIDMYPFPKNWPEIIEQIRYELDKMTAKEKAVIELPHELRAFVELLGYDAVSAELQKFRT
ncbi:MAG: hypothetical protein WCV58_03850 [Patescibacteria group bacterium]